MIDLLTTRLGTSLQTFRLHSIQFLCCHSEVAAATEEPPHSARSSDESSGRLHPENCATRNTGVLHFVQDDGINGLRYSSEPPADIPPALPLLPVEGEAIIIEAPPPSDASGPGVPARIPHMGHALLFVSFAFLVLLLSQAVLLDLTHPPRNPQKILLAMQPRYVVLAMAFAYIITLISSYFFFPLLWMRSFGSGLQWDGATALRNAHKLIPTGILMAFAVGAISKFFLPMPKSIPMDEFFKNSSDAWLVTAFGILLAPMFEEICFRGFLLPAIAIAYDWLSLPRTPAARERWHITTGLSMPALLFSAIISSLFFTLLHAEQLAHAWAVLFVLFCVSLVLTAVRLRIRSVAASTLVHASYNFTLFFGMFVATGGYRHLERMTR